MGAWLVATEDDQVASAVVDLYGGMPKPSSSRAGAVIEVLTSSDRVMVLLEEVSVAFRMVAAGVDESLHACDGDRFVEPAAKRGTACGCPPSLSDRRAAALAGRGPSPEVRLGFRLAGRPGLGVFSLVSTSWEFAAEQPELADALRRAGAPLLCALVYERVDFVTRSGVPVSYRRPRVEIGGARVLSPAGMCLAV
ncbi:hypothetical protein ABT354_17150 [Streptomyces sp. NPDC000594]|uniref:hypothetical protein n=1 Tax=Streptomyces sp. NPDC000594 TaxID=3154261 RepID=UPI003332E4D2